MLNIKKTLVNFLASTALACSAELLSEETTAVSSFQAPISLEVASSIVSPGKAVVIDDSSLKPITNKYNVYVSLEFEGIENTHPGHVEIFEHLKGPLKSELKSKFKDPMIVTTPHVTLCDATVELDTSAQSSLEGNLKGILNVFKGKTLQIEDVEVGGMYGGLGNSPYFIAYNLNKPGSALKVLSHDISEIVKGEAKKYDDYLTLMTHHSFDGVFKKHLPTTSNEELLHLSILRSYNSRKTHKTYRDAWVKRKGFVNEYDKLWTAFFDKILRPLENQEVVKNKDGILKIFNALFLDAMDKSLAILDAKGVPGDLSLFNADTIEAAKKLTFRGKPEAGLKCIQNKIWMQYIGSHIAVLGDNREYGIKLSKDFVQGNISRDRMDPTKPTESEDEFVFLVPSSEVVRENKEVDLLCQSLQKSIGLEHLNLKVKDYRLDFRLLTY